MADILRIGHRGAAGHAPENTLASFEKAIELEVDMIELDVQRCKSGELVVFHDYKLKRMAGKRGYVSDLSLAELKKLDIQGQQIPTLEEALDLIDGRVQVNVELKGTQTAEQTNEILERYIGMPNWTADHFLVSSFNHYELRHFSELNPEVRTGALVLGILIGYAKFAKAVDAYSVNAGAEFINKRYVDDAHKRGLKIFTWTVNDQDEIDQMKELGVDGIFSNYPERI